MSERKHKDGKRKNEKVIARIAVRPEAIRIRKDDFFTNARSQFPKEPLESLKASIQNLGLLKQLAVERDPNDKDGFVLLAGERRHICISELKKENASVKDLEGGGYAPASKVYEYVEVKVFEPKNDLERLEIMVAENGQHSQVPDWDYFKFAQWLDGQKNDDNTKKYSRKDLCRIFNKSAPWVSHTLSLADLPDRAKKCLENGRLSRTAAVDLLSAKEDKYETVLTYAESVVIRNAEEEKADAKREQFEAEIELETAEVEQQQAESVGDRLLAKMVQKRGTQARRKLQGAHHKEDRANRTLANPVITEEAVKQVFDECPDTLQPGVAPKTRSPKRMRSQLKTIEILLDEQAKSGYILNSQTGRKYPKDDVHLVLAAYRQMLGQNPLNLFALLDGEYDARQKRKEEAA